MVASVGDAAGYIGANTRPVERMLGLLTECFSPASAEPGFSLALGGGGLRGLVSATLGSGYYGRGYGPGSGFGASSKLSHDHRTQFTFVYQTLSLWREVRV